MMPCLFLSFFTFSSISSIFFFISSSSSSCLFFNFETGATQATGPGQHWHRLCEDWHNWARLRERGVQEAARPPSGRRLDASRPACAQMRVPHRDHWPHHRTNKQQPTPTVPHRRGPRRPSAAGPRGGRRHRAVGGHTAPPQGLPARFE